MAKGKTGPEGAATECMGGPSISALLVERGDQERRSEDEVQGLTGADETSKPVGAGLDGAPGRAAARGGPVIASAVKLVRMLWAHVAPGDVVLVRFGEHRHPVEVIEVEAFGLVVRWGGQPRYVRTDPGQMVFRYLPIQGGGR